MELQKCGECGAELRLRPASCPLCGASTEVAPATAGEIDPDDYHSNVRQLRDELKRLRDTEAEAV